MPGIVKKVPAVVGGMSLIGTGDERPVSWGNYFALRDPYIRVLNFWAENLEAAVEQKLLEDGQVQIRVWEWEVKNERDQARGASCCIIDDPRIPSEWYYNKLCFTGFGKPPIEIAKEIYDYLGDPNNQFEQFTDPEMYYARRGGVWNERGGISYGFGDDRKTPEELIAALLEKRKKQLH